MENYVSGQSVSITNPSQLVLSVDEFLKLSKKLPSQSEELHEREQTIFSHFGPKKQQEYPKTLIFEINLDKIADQINKKYEDGFYFEDDYDIVISPFDTTIRRRPTKLDDPTLVKDLSPKKISSINVGNPTIMENNIVLNKSNASLLAFSHEFESEGKRR